jgi:TolB-like protein
VSFFSELRRRNVFRVGIAYAVAAWLMLQIADVLIDNIGAPDWVFPTLLMVLGIGFPVALIFAWAFELTPEGLKRESEVDRASSVVSHTARKLDRLIIVVLVLAVAYLLVDRFALQDNNVSHVGEPSSAAEDAPRPESDTSVAVLPFVNMSRDSDNEYFSDGISEELLNLLVKVEGLRVPSRTSSFAFKGQNRDIREIAEQLEVDHILEGSVRKAGNQVRITAQLIDVSTDTHLWSETYDRELEDIFAIQDEIASEIVGALQGMLGTTVSHERPTDSLEAYNLYLQGLYLFQRRGEALIEAEQLLRQTVALDPDFADAWAILGLTLIMQPNYVQRPLEEAVPLALEAADRADALEPGRAEVYMVRGNAAAKSGQFAEALALNGRAVELHPNHSLAQLWFGIQLLNAGYIAEAEEHLLTAQKLDPASGLILDWVGRTQVMLAKYDSGRENLLRAIQFNRPQAVWGLGVVTLEGHLPPDRFLEIAGMSNPLFKLAALLSVPVNAGELSAAEAERRVRETYPGELFEQYGVLLLSSHTGNIDGMAKTFPAVWPYDTAAINVIWYAPFGALRNHPVVKAELERMGIADVWRDRGWPDLCRPMGEDDFECD